MEPSPLLVALMCVAVLSFLLTGYPVAFVLAGTALLFAAIGLTAGVIEPGFIDLLPEGIYGIIQNELLLAVPLFIAMGVMLERSRVAEDLLDSMGRLFGPVRGGLGFSVTVVGALMAASTGIVGATVVTMGLMSLPTMLRRGYDPALASGTITAAGTLGQIIPPSIVLILLADVISSSYQQAQRELGVAAPEAVGVGHLFAGALLPGLGLVGLYLLYQALMAWLRPASSPAIERAPGEGVDKGLLRTLLASLLPPLVLIVAVLGSILMGVATPTEAAAVGAVGAIMLGSLRLAKPPAWPVLAGLAALLGVFVQSALIGPASSGPAFVSGAVLSAVAALGLAVALLRLHRQTLLSDVLQSTVRISVMVYVILIGAVLFALVFRALGGDVVIEEALTNLPGGVAGALIIVMAVMFLLGFFLDFIQITFVVVPIVAPALFLMGVDPVWLGVMMGINLQTSFLTPPFGFALFYLRGAAPESVRTVDIYRGAVPFVLIQLLALTLLALAPEVVTWLPGLLFDSN